MAKSDVISHSVQTTVSFLNHPHTVLLSKPQQSHQLNSKSTNSFSKPATKY